MKIFFATSISSLALLASVTANAISLDQLRQGNKIATFLDKQLTCYNTKNAKISAQFHLEQQLSLRVGGETRYWVISSDSLNPDLEVIEFKKIKEGIEFTALVAQDRANESMAIQIKCEVVQ